MSERSDISTIERVFFSTKAILCTFIIACIFHIPLSAQDRCSQAQDIGIGNCLTLFNGPATADDGTGQFCSDYENNYWYTFVAVERITRVAVIPTYCVNSAGLEMEIFQVNACTFFDTPIACGATMGVIPLSFTITTVIGETYYIIIDGIRGDICDFKLNLIHGECPLNPPACDTLPEPIILGQDSICFGQGTFIYEIDNYDPGLTYYWSIPDLSEFTDLGDGRIEIDWTNYSGGGSPMVCVAGVNDRCIFRKSCKVIINTDIGIDLDPQIIRRCTHSFPLTLDDYFHLLFINQLVPVPDGLRKHFYLSLEDLLNDENEVTQLDSHGNYTIFLALSIGNCSKTVLPADTAHIETEYLDIDVQTSVLCEGELFNFSSDIEVTELNGYSGWPFDSLSYYSTAADAAVDDNRIPMPYSIEEGGQYWARFNTTNGCHDTVSFDIEFHLSPVFTASSPDTICSVNGNATYNLLSTPFDFTVGDFSEVFLSFYRSEYNALNGINEIGALVSTTRTYYAVATSFFGCKSDPVPIDVVFEYSPYIEIFGNGDLCAGDSGEIVITTINTPLPFTLEIEDEHGNNFIIHGNQSSFFYYIPIYESSEFHIVEFQPGAPVHCPYVTSENVEFEVIRLPQAALEIATGCGQETGVYLRASQNGDFYLHIRNIISGAAYSFLDAQNNGFLSIPVVDGDVLVLDSFQYNYECWSYVADTTPAVVVQEPLEINNISIGACDPLQSVISFTVDGGDPATYIVHGISGGFQNGQHDFTSDPLSTDSYQIVVTDGRACDTVFLQIMIDCGCRTEAGSIQIQNPIRCEDDPIFVSSLLDTQSVTGDIFQFILHDRQAPEIGNIIQSNSSGIFIFDDDVMNIGTPYFISMWVGPGLNGQVDTSAFCSVLTGSVEISWLETPVVELFDSLFLCESPADTIVRINFMGSGPYTISYAIGNTLFGPITTADNYLDILISGISQDGMLEITEFSNAHCDGIINGAGDIIFLPSPDFQNLVYSCAPSKDSFSFEFEVIDGTPPYIITGVAGQWLGNTFISANLPSGYADFIYLADINSCSTVEILIERDCECESETGILPLTDLHLCADSIIILPFTVDPVISLGDAQMFLIKDNDLPDTTGILDIISNPIIQFNPAYMNYGETFYIIPVTSVVDGNGNIILGHKCFMPSAPVAFTFYDDAELNIETSNDTLNCVIEEIVIDAGSSIIPIGYQYEWQVLSGQILSGATTLQPVVAEAGRYLFVVYNPLAGCRFEQEVVIHVNHEMAEAFISADTLLNCAQPILVLDGQASSSGPDYIFDWQTENGHFVSNPGTLTPQIDQAGTYTLFVENKSSGCRDTAEITIRENFTFPNAAMIATNIELTCALQSIVLMVDTSRLLAEDNVDWFATQIFTQISPFEIELSAPGNYGFVITNANSQCRDTVELEILQDITAPLLELADSHFVDCVNDIVDIRVDIINPNSDGHLFHWSGNTPIIGSPDLEQIMAAEEGQLMVEVTDEYNGCSSVAHTRVIALQEPISDVALAIHHSPCGTENQGYIQLQSIIGGTAPFQISIDENVFGEIPLTTGQLEAGIYDIMIEDENLCRFDTSVLLRNLENVTLDLPPFITVDEGNPIHVIPTMSGLIDTFFWFINDSVQVIVTSLDPILYPEEDYVLSLMLISPDGCIAEQSVQVYVRKFYNIFIPTGFSPNGDGTNDRLVIYGPEKLQEIESFQIFNRWGNKMFEAYNFIPNDLNIGWDGMRNDQLAPSDVYIYQLKGVFNDGTIKEYTGEFSLIR